MEKENLKYKYYIIAKQYLTFHHTHKYSVLEHNIPTKQKYKLLKLIKYKTKINIQTGLLRLYNIEIPTYSGFSRKLFSLRINAFLSFNKICEKM